MYNGGMNLKPQDIYVALKIAAAGERRASYSQLGLELGMSPSEVHACVERAVTSHLLHPADRQHRPNAAALEEFLVHGLKYVFPADRGEPTRGVATSYGAKPLRALIAARDEAVPVWPHAAGRQRGVAMAPLHKSAPVAALRDPAFYEYLALADALRDGRVRERKLAQAELHRRLRQKHA